MDSFDFEPNLLGVWNDEEDAEKSEKELEQILKAKQNNKTIYRTKISSRIRKPDEEEKLEDNISNENIEEDKRKNSNSNTNTNYNQSNKDLKNSVFSNEPIDDFRTTEYETLKKHTINTVNETTSEESNLKFSGNDLKDSIDLGIQNELKNILNPRFEQKSDFVSENKNQYFKNSQQHKIYRTRINQVNPKTILQVIYLI